MNPFNKHARVIFSVITTRLNIIKIRELMIFIICKIKVIVHHWFEYICKTWIMYPYQSLVKYDLCILLNYLKLLNITLLSLIYICMHIYIHIYICTHMCTCACRAYTQIYSRKARKLLCDLQLQCLDIWQLEKIIFWWK